MEEEKKETTKEEKTLNEKICEKVENKIQQILNEGIRQDNIDYLYKLEDVKKDVANENYWKEKIDMMYRNSGYGEDSYGRRTRDSRGRFMEGSYGRRGTGRGRYRGEEMIDDMMYHYGNYSEGSESYGADEETMKSFKYMLKSFKDYYKHLKQEASSQQEVQMLEDVAREISEM